jgi:hypothetical protein
VVSHSLTQPTVVIGDLVGSRRARDRRALHAELMSALDAANTRYPPAEPLAPTVGDEFQGVFHNVGDAVRATLLVRASMGAGHDVRFGLGVGPVQRLGKAANAGFQQQDGPGWWAARDAIDYVAAAPAGRRVPHTLRTALFVADRHGARNNGVLFAIAPSLDEHPDARSVNAFLVARDHTVSRMDDRDRRILRALLLDTPVTAIAEQEGVSASAISQRSQRSGAAALVYAHEVAL